MRTANFYIEDYVLCKRCVTTFRKLFSSHHGSRSGVKNVSYRKKEEKMHSARACSLVEGKRGDPRKR